MILLTFNRSQHKKYNTLLIILVLILPSVLYAFQWQNLWLNKDQLGKKLMQKGQYETAEATFVDPAWRATAAYLANNYTTAAKYYQSMQNELGFYNLGNALAKSKNYAAAISAYDKALAINPQNLDAKFNRELIMKLIKDQQTQQEKEQKGQQQGQQQQKKQQQHQAQQEQTSQQKQQGNQLPQAGSEAAQTDQSKQSKFEDTKDNQEIHQSNQNTIENSASNPQKNHVNQNLTQQKQIEPQPESDLQLNNVKSQDTKSSDPDHANMKQGDMQEDDYAKEQWLKLIPDDPGGLLRAKFLRDHLNRQHGWN